MTTTNATANAFLSLPADQQALLVQKLLERAAAARNDPCEFFSLVMREEKTQRAVAAVPHQRVLLQFITYYKRCVVRMPIGSSKTFCTAAFTMWLLGQDPSTRGAIVSATQGQAAKPLGMVRDYIETSWALRLVFPQLVRSMRTADSWAQTEITVNRPPGIRDASLVAVGVDGSLPGSRLSWIVVDDILSRENTLTPDGRQKVYEFFDSTVLSRLDPDGEARLVVTNTPWHPEDLTYVLERAGWPTLTMDVEGGIFLSNCDDWDTDDIRPGHKPGEWYRLSAHEPDPQEQKVLWPARLTPEWIEDMRRTHLPHRFNQLFMSQCRDDATARCKQDWIDQCKVRGLTMMSEYRGGNPTVTGVDLAVGKTSAHDTTAFFTFECLPNGKRRILDVEFGQFDAPTIMQKIIAKAKAYNSIVRVENNAAQDYILQFCRAANASVPIKAHTTGRAKAHPEFGVESLFVELQNGAWMIPANDWGNMPKPVAEWAKACTDYIPGKHTGDLLMACWFAREQARELGHGYRPGGVSAQTGALRGIASSIMSR